jgi:hypothetical protein
MVTHIGGSRLQEQWRSIGIHQKRVFCPLFPAICWAGATSVTATECSNLSRINNNGFRVEESSAVQLLKQTLMQPSPDTGFLPTFNRVRAVSPLQPNSFGTSRQRHPTVSTNQITFKTLKLSIG